jgi:hypothetical protein
MSTSEHSMSEATNATTQVDISKHNLLLTAFIAAIFLSAVLLFAVQPMFTKMVLPRLGGAAAVWSVALVFFQTTLLAGYAYTHLLTRFAPGRTSVIIHLGLMVVACFALPLHITSGWGRPPPEGEAFWLLGLFTVSIGLPFFALAANAPLLQAWFVRTGHPDAKEPYFLYAASNVGSFLALLSYPVAVEPFVRLGAQTWIWTVGFYVLIVLIVGCGVLLLRSPNQVVSEVTARPDDATARPEEAAPPTWGDVTFWVALTAVPSGLLIAVTAHIATDVAAVALFWVVPLALYLMTFVIVFQARPLIPHWLVVKIQPIFVLLLIAGFILDSRESIITTIVLHLSVFFVCVLMCHGELARRRPAPQYLTSYYMWMSVGGMIGGVTTGLFAPWIFNWVMEYPLLLVLVVLCRPGLSFPAKGTGQYSLFAALGVGALLMIGAAAFDLWPDATIYTVMIGVLLGLTVHYWGAPLPFAAIVAFVLVVNHQINETSNSYRVRNFFGVLNATETWDGMYRVLMQGSTGQGAQRIRDDNGKPLTGRPEMISEFYAGGGIAQTFDAVRARIGGPTNVAVIGLGTGSLACTVRRGDALTYYELDPDVVRIARNPKLFNFISACAPDIKIVIGDARLTLADASDGSYDLIFVDAFLGAAIPVHLLTREAMTLYFRKLKPNGILAMHVSNISLELASVVAGVAESHGFITRVYDGGDMEADPSRYIWVPRVAAVARKDEDFGALAKSQFWPIRERDTSQSVWTDDYSNIAGAMVRNLQEWRQSSGN